MAEQVTDNPHEFDQISPHINGHLTIVGAPIPQSQLPTCIPSLTPNAAQMTTQEAVALSPDPLEALLGDRPSVGRKNPEMETSGFPTSLFSQMENGIPVPVVVELPQADESDGEEEGIGINSQKHHEMHMSRSPLPPPPPPPLLQPRPQSRLSPSPPVQETQENSLFTPQQLNANGNHALATIDGEQTALFSGESSVMTTAASPTGLSNGTSHAETMSSLPWRARLEDTRYEYGRRAYDMGGNIVNMASMFISLQLWRSLRNFDDFFSEIDREGTRMGDFRFLNRVLDREKTLKQHEVTEGEANEDNFEPITTRSREKAPKADKELMQQRSETNILSVCAKECTIKGEHNLFNFSERDAHLHLHNFSEQSLRAHENKLTTILKDMSNEAILEDSAVARDDRTPKSDDYRDKQMTKTQTTMYSKKLTDTRQKETATLPLRSNRRKPLETFGAQVRTMSLRTDALSHSPLSSPFPGLSVRRRTGLGAIRGDNAITLLDKLTETESDEDIPASSLRSKRSATGKASPQEANLAQITPISTTDSDVTPSEDQAPQHYIREPVQIGPTLRSASSSSPIFAETVSKDNISTTTTCGCRTPSEGDSTAYPPSPWTGVVLSHQRYSRRSGLSPYHVDRRSGSVDNSSVWPSRKRSQAFPHSASNVGHFPSLNELLHLPEATSPVTCVNESCISNTVDPENIPPTEPDTLGFAYLNEALLSVASPNRDKVISDSEMDGFVDESRVETDLFGISASNLPIPFSEWTTEEDREKAFRKKHVKGIISLSEGEEEDAERGSTTSDSADTEVDVFEDTGYDSGNIHSASYFPRAKQATYETDSAPVASDELPAGDRTHQLASVPSFSSFSSISTPLLTSPPLVGLSRIPSIFSSSSTNPFAHSHAAAQSTPRDRDNTEMGPTQHNLGADAYLSSRSSSNDLKTPWMHHDRHCTYEDLPPDHPCARLHSHTKGNAHVQIHPHQATQMLRVHSMIELRSPPPTRTTEFYIAPAEILPALSPSFAAVRELKRPAMTAVRSVTATEVDATSIWTEQGDGLEGEVTADASRPVAPRVSTTSPSPKRTVPAAMDTQAPVTSPSAGTPVPGIRDEPMESMSPSPPREYAPGALTPIQKDIVSNETLSELNVATELIATPPPWAGVPSQSDYYAGHRGFDPLSVASAHDVISNPQFASQVNFRGVLPTNDLAFIPAIPDDIASLGQSSRGAVEHHPCGLDFISQLNIFPTIYSMETLDHLITPYKIPRPVLPRAVTPGAPGPSATTATQGSHKKKRTLSRDAMLDTLYADYVEALSTTGSETVTKASRKGSVDKSTWYNALVMYRKRCASEGARPSRASSDAETEIDDSAGPGPVRRSDDRHRAQSWTPSSQLSSSRASASTRAAPAASSGIVSMSSALRRKLDKR